MQTGYNQFWTLPNYDSSSYPQQNYSQYQTNSVNFLSNEQCLNHINYIGVGHSTSVYQNDRNNVENNNWMTGVNQIPEQIQHQQKKRFNVDDVYLNTQLYKVPDYNLCQHYGNCNSMNNDQADWISQIPPHISKNSNVQKINCSRPVQHKNIQPNLITSNNGCKTIQSPKIRVKDVFTLNKSFENYDANKKLCKTSGNKGNINTLSSLTAQRNEIGKSHKIPLPNSSSLRQSECLMNKNFYQGESCKNNSWSARNQHCEENLEINSTLCHCVNDDGSANQSRSENANFSNSAGISNINNKEKPSCAKYPICKKNSNINGRQELEKTMSKESPERVLPLSQSNRKQILEARQSENGTVPSSDPLSTTAPGLQDFPFPNCSHISCSVSERILRELNEVFDEGDTVVPKSEPSVDDINNVSSDCERIGNTENIEEKILPTKKLITEQKITRSGSIETIQSIVEYVKKTNPKEQVIVQKPTTQNSQTQTNLSEVVKSDKKKKKRPKENFDLKVNANLEKQVLEMDSEYFHSKKILSQSCKEPEVQLKQAKNPKKTESINMEKFNELKSKCKIELDKNKLNLLKKFVEKNIHVDTFSVRDAKERKDCEIITSHKRKCKDDSSSLTKKKISKESVAENKSNSKESVSVMSVKSQSTQKCPIFSFDPIFIDETKIKKDRKHQEKASNKKEDYFRPDKPETNDKEIKTKKSLGSASNSIIKEKSSKLKDLCKIKNLALKEQNKLKSKYSKSEENEKNKSARRDSTKENFNDSKDKSKKYESPKVVSKKSNGSSEKFESDLLKTKEATSEKNEIFRTIKGFHKGKLHHCKNCHMNSSSDCFWVNAVSGDVKCLNCFKLEADEAKIKKIKHKDKETSHKEKRSSRHYREEKKDDRQKVHSKSKMETKALHSNQNEENACKKKSCGKTDKSALLAQLYKKTKKLSWTLLGET